MFDVFLGTMQVVYSLTLGTLEPACQWLLGALLAHLGVRGAVQVPVDWWNGAKATWNAGRRFKNWCRQESKAAAWKRRMDERMDFLMRKDMERGETLMPNRRTPI